MLSIFYRLLSLHLRATLIIAALLTIPGVMFAQSALTDDAYTSGNSRNADGNLGTKTSLTISPSGNVYIKFKLSSTLPSSTPGSDVARATLKLYISTIVSEGKIDIYQVTSAWDEGTITFNTAPTLGSLVATSVQIEEDKKGKFVTFDVTPAVQQWLGDDGQGTNGAVNHGLALVPHPVDASTPALANITFDSKENVQTSHEPQLHIALRKPAGLETVAHDATLSGDGTVTNPVRVAVGGVNTAHLADGAVTEQKIGAGHVVKSLNGLSDNVTLQAGPNITITPSGNTLTIEGSGNSLSTVSHNSSLTGDGTSGSPLGIAAPLTLNNSDASPTLSVTNSGGGPAISTAGAINTSTQYNIGGSRVLSVSGLQNTFVGISSGQRNTTGAANSFFGTNSGSENNASFNSFFGWQAGFLNTTGAENSFFGADAGGRSIGGTANSFFGVRAGFNTTGVQNSFYGVRTGLSNTTGSSNSFFGNEAGRDNTTGNVNAFFGTVAGGTNTTGTGNSFFGHGAGWYNTTGGNNSFFGSFTGNAITSENNNTFIGSLSNGVAGITNATAIGFDARVTQSNSVVLGKDASVGIGVTAPAYKLHVIDPSNTGLRVQTNTVGGKVASFGGAGDFQIDASGVEGGRFVVKENGDVGIGVSQPSARLEVQGGSIRVGSAGQGIILKSPNGATCRLLTIDNSGGITLAPTSCL